MHEVMSSFDSNTQVDISFLDFSKAFDYLIRDHIWYKLIKLGVRGNILNVRSKVKVENDVSDSFQCYLGVRQGESLSPFLYIFFNVFE